MRYVVPSEQVAKCVDLVIEEGRQPWIVYASNVGRRSYVSLA